MVSQQIKVGLLVDRDKQPLWVLDAVEALLASNIEVSIIFCDVKVMSRPSGVRFQNLLFRLWYRVMLQLKGTQEGNLSEKFGELNMVDCLFIREKYVDRIHNESYIELVEHSYDYLVRFGLNILRGDVLKVARHGVLSYHHGDEWLFRGRPSVFWEKYNGNNTATGVLQVLSERLDAGKVVAKWSVGIKNCSLLEAQNKLKIAGIKFLSAYILGTYLEEESPYEMVGVRPNINRYPTNAEMLRYLWIAISEKINYTSSRIYEQNWEVIILKDGRKSGGIKAESRDFVADPFVFVDNERILCFYEYFDRNKNKGRIDVAVYDKNMNLQNCHTILEEDFHLSFPSFYRESGKFYLIPECQKSHNQYIYHIDLNSLKIVERKVLIRDVHIEDPQLLYHDNELVLFGSSNATLYVWNGLSLEEENEVAPTIVSSHVNKSRAGGMIVKRNSKYYIPLQKTSNYYGESVSLFELKPAAWRISKYPVMTIGKEIIDNSIGVHTYNQSIGGEYEVIDSLNFELKWQN